MFTLPEYCAPDFSAPLLQNAPSVRTAPAPADGAAPAGYHATGMYPEYYKVDGVWRLAEKSRMDCVSVLAPDGELRIVEFRNLVQGDSVVLGRTDDGSEGILMHTEGFSAGGKSAEAFAFRTGRSRETAFTRDYDALAGLLRHEKEHGNVVWVLGPACSFDASAKAAMQALIENGYAHGLLAGNALATHDLEGSLLHTALGQDIYTQESRPNGHYHHIDVINAARAAGSIPAFIEQNGIRDGIMHACVAHGVPYVLAGSIRDDGPLPGVYGDVYAGAERHAGAGAAGHHRHLCGHPAAYHCHGQYDAFLLCARRPGTAGIPVLCGYLRVRHQQTAGQGQPFQRAHRGQCTGLFVPRGRRARLAGCGKI